MTIGELLLKRLVENDEWVSEIITDKYHILLWKACRKTKSEDALCEQLVTQVFECDT